mgnify:FL=1|tara:strand:+ start:123 stop:536 length:414 start_codon:yes stop_codon:yes gene_type:complete
MIYTFKSYGHRNVLGNHKTTLEFTKDTSINIEADCIIGVNANFELDKLKEFIQYCKENNKEKVKITIEANGITETIFCHLNFLFDDEKEVVIRTTKFISKRTFGILANKSSKYLKRELINQLKEGHQEINISLSPME